MVDAGEILCWLCRDNTGDGDETGERGPAEETFGEPNKHELPLTPFLPLFASFFKMSAAFGWVPRRQQEEAKKKGVNRSVGHPS